MNAPIFMVNVAFDKVPKRTAQIYIQMENIFTDSKGHLDCLRLCIPRNPKPHVLIVDVVWYECSL